MLRKLMFILLNFCAVAVSAQIVQKSSAVAGVDFRLDGIMSNLSNSGAAAGAIIHGGYDIYFRNLPFLTVEPRLGVGYFSGGHTKAGESVSYKDYAVGCFMFGVSPKLYLSINEDDNVYLFLENELSFLTAFATVNDENSTRARHESDACRFYYTCKIGLQFKVSDNGKMAAWVGGSTLRFDHVLNKGLPAGQPRWLSETASICAGLDYYFRY